MVFWATVLVVCWQGAVIKHACMDGAEFYWARPSDVMNNGELVSTALKNPPLAPLCAAKQTKSGNSGGEQLTNRFLLLWC